MNNSRFNLKSFLRQRLFLAGEEIVGEMERTIPSSRPVAGVSRSMWGVEGVGPRRLAAAHPLTSSTTEPGDQCDPPLMQQNPGPSQTSADLDCKDWNISPEDTDLKICQLKEEPEDESQTQEIVFPSPDILKSEQEQPEIKVSPEMQPGPWNCSVVKTENNEELVNRKGGPTKTVKRAGKSSQGKRVKKKKGRAVLRKKKLSAKDRKNLKFCPLCGKSYKQNGAVKRHMKTHQAKTDCALCVKKFNTTKKLVIHLKHCHNNTLFCELCGSAFASSNALKMHEEMHMGMKACQCQECGETFKSADHLIVHVRRHTGEKPYQCDICSQRFPKIGGLRRHRKKHTVSPLTSSTTEPGVQRVMQLNPGPSQSSADLDCKDWNISPEDTDLKLCQIKEELGDESQTQEIVFPSPEIMKSEQEQPEIQVPHEMQPGSWNCSAVKTENNDRDEEPLHSQAVLPNEKLSTKNLKDREVCHWCGQSFKLIYALTKHIKRHKSLTSCDVCGTEFQSTKLLVLHLKHFHKNTWFCEVCGNTFRNGSSLKIHERMHTDMKEFPCQACGKTFSSSDQLVEHVRTHTWETPYQCDICGKAFSQSQDLTVHKKSHSDKMPHSCSLCGQRFDKKTTLKSHMRRHSGVNSYPCDLCDERFSQPGMLKSHRSTHQRRFACQVCGRRYKSQKTVEVHLRSHEMSDAE